MKVNAGRREPSPTLVVAPMTGMTELSYTLWRQRRLLELLVYKLEVQQLLLAAGRTRWVGAAAREVEAVLDQIRQEELARAVQVNALAAELGLSAEPPLKEIIDAAPAPWDEILREHQAAFLALAAEVEGLTRHNRELLNRGYQATREFMASVEGVDAEPDGYSAAGTSTHYRMAHHTVDRVV